MNKLHLAVQFFFQLAVILLVCRLVGIVAKRVGQPQVVAEMIAGVMLGPSLFGLLAPEMAASNIPVGQNSSHQRYAKLSVPVSQLGLALYMFVVGMEFSHRHH